MSIVTILSEYQARQQRVLNPLGAPRLAAALVASACDWTLLPLVVASAAVAGYAEAQAAVLTPGGAR